MSRYAISIVKVCKISIDLSLYSIHAHLALLYPWLTRIYAPICVVFQSSDRSILNGAEKWS